MSVSKISALSLAALIIATPGFAQQSTDVPRDNSSVFTKLDLDTCHYITNEELGLPPMSEEEEGVGSASWLCIGYNRTIVYAAEGDLRMFLSFGPNAMQEIAARQTLPEFNTFGDTIEWRLHSNQISASTTPTQPPFATIHTLHTESGDRAEIKGEVLVVTKLEPGNTCHVAYIDTQLVPNAHEVALWYADNEVANFNCATDDILVVPT